VVNLRLEVATWSAVTFRRMLPWSTRRPRRFPNGGERGEGLPLNGRSIDNLITLNPARSTIAHEKRYTSTAMATRFRSRAADRRQPVLLNGIEYTGASQLAVIPAARAANSRY